MKLNTWLTTPGSSMQVMFAGDGSIMVSAVGINGALRFTPDEWDAFVAGVKDGEFDL